MFNIKRVDNLDQFEKWSKDKRIVFKANDEGMVNGEIDVKSVGPCVIRAAVDVGEKAPKTFLLDTIEGAATLRFAVGSAEVHLLFEPSAEVWFRKADNFAVADNPNPLETFTRMENMALEMDELGIALHRQEIMMNIRNGRENMERDAYQRKLESQLGELTSTIAALKKGAEQEELARQEQDAQQRGLETPA